jgi:transcriptional regulator with XRE-family HTH domain
MASAERLRRAREAIRWHDAGWNTRQIARRFGVSQTTIVRDLALIRNDDKEQIAAALLGMGEPEVPSPPDFTEARKIRWELTRDLRSRDAALLRALGFSVDRSARIMGVSPATVRRYLRARDEP